MDYREFYNKNKFDLYATGDSNWDLYTMQYKDNPPVLVCLAKPGTGAMDCGFGSLDYLDRLERQGYDHGYTRISGGEKGKECKMTNTYNGWKNRQTWNVALWLNNDEWLYRAALEYVGQARRPTWRGLIAWLGLEGQRTPDGIAWDGTRLDYAALNEMLREMKGE